MGDVGAMRHWLGMPMGTPRKRKPTPLLAFSLLAAMIPLLGTAGIDAVIEPEGPPIHPSRRRGGWCNRCRGTGDIGNGRACPNCAGGGG